MSIERFGGGSGLTAGSETTSSRESTRPSPPAAPAGPASSTAFSAGSEARTTSSLSACVISAAARDWLKMYSNFSAFVVGLIITKMAPALSTAKTARTASTELSR